MQAAKDQGTRPAETAATDAAMWKYTEVALLIQVGTNYQRLQNTLDTLSIK